MQVPFTEPPTITDITASIMGKDSCPLNVLCDELNQQAVDTTSYRQRKQDALQALKKHTKGIVPSGPRKEGEGCEDDPQGILSAEQTPRGGAKLTVTLLAAGFIIGPQGGSIREIMQVSGANIKSWNEKFDNRRKVRILELQNMPGKQQGVIKALEIITAAVDRYKELCEGKYAGKQVNRIQVVKGISFTYSPPPRSAVPFAAGLKPETVPSPMRNAATKAKAAKRLSSSQKPTKNAHRNSSSSTFTEDDEDEQYEAAPLTSSAVLGIMKGTYSSHQNHYSSSSEDEQDDDDFLPPSSNDRQPNNTHHRHGSFDASPLVSMGRKLILNDEDDGGVTEATFSFFSHPLHHHRHTAGDSSTVVVGHHHHQQQSLFGGVSPTMQASALLNTSPQSQIRTLTDAERRALGGRFPIQAPLRFGGGCGSISEQQQMQQRTAMDIEAPPAPRSQVSLFQNGATRTTHPSTGVFGSTTYHHAQQQQQDASAQAAQLLNPFYTPSPLAKVSNPPNVLGSSSINNALQQQQWNQGPAIGQHHFAAAAGTQGGGNHHRHHGPISSVFASSPFDTNPNNNNNSLQASYQGNQQQQFVQLPSPLPTSMTFHPLPPLKLQQDQPASYQHLGFNDPMAVDNNNVNQVTWMHNNTKNTATQQYTQHVLRGSSSAMTGAVDLEMLPLGEGLISGVLKDAFYPSDANINTTTTATFHGGMKESSGTKIFEESAMKSCGLPTFSQFASLSPMYQQPQQPGFANWGRQ